MTIKSFIQSCQDLIKLEPDAGNWEICFSEFIDKTDDENPDVGYMRLDRPVIAQMVDFKTKELLILDSESYNTLESIKSKLKE